MFHFLQQLIFRAEATDRRTSGGADTFSTTWLRLGAPQRPEWESRREREAQQRRREEREPGTGFSIEGEGRGRKAEEGQERERENGVIWGDEGDKGGGETFGRRDKVRGRRVLGVQQQRGECAADVLSVKLLSQSDPAQVGAPLHSFYTTHTHIHTHIRLILKNIKLKHTSFEQTA